MVVAVIVRHQRPQTNRTALSTDPLRLPRPRRARLDGHAVVLGDRGEAGLHLAGAGHGHRGQPVGPPHPGGAPEAAQHPVHRLDQMRLLHRLRKHPRTRPECGRVASSTYAVPPQGAWRRSNQSHWCSAPGGWVVWIVARPRTPVQAWQCGPSPAPRSWRAKLTQLSPQPSRVTSSYRALAQMWGSSAKRAAR